MKKECKRPQYPNGCRACVFLGRMGKSDLYYCKDMERVVSRHGISEEIYDPFVVGHESEELQEANRRAIQRGLYK